MTFNIQAKGFRIRLDINRKTGKTTIRYNGKKIQFSPQNSARTDSRSIFHFQTGKGIEAQYYEIEYCCQSHERSCTHQVICKMNGTPFFRQKLDEKIQ